MDKVILVSFAVAMGVTFAVPLIAWRKARVKARKQLQHIDFT